MSKHPIYGYLTKEEFEKMKTAPFGAAEEYKKKAQSRFLSEKQKTKKKK